MKRKLLCAVSIGIIAGAAGLAVNTAHAQEQRPGAKNDAGVVNPTHATVYPDLEFCVSKLRDPSIYRGAKRRILKQIEPGLDGWLYRTADFRTDFTLDDKTFDYMIAVNESLRQKGTDLYIVLQPPRAMLMHQYINPKHMPEGYDHNIARQNYKALIRRFNDAGIHAVDLSDTPEDLVYFFKGDPHWRREGAQWTAQKVGEMIRKNPQYSDIKKEEFSIEITWWLESEKGEFDEFVDKICDVNIPPERRPMWATTSLSGVSEDSLFGDVTYPDIAIIGTSNTAHEEDFNFVGSLKQELKADIRNHAMSAGAFSGSALTFFSTDEFHEAPPKILIWEFLSHHKMDDYVGFRQMLPAIEGECDINNAFAAAESFNIDIPEYKKRPVKIPVRPMKPGVKGPPSPLNPAVTALPVQMHEIIVLDNLEDRAIRAQNSYIQLDVTAPENRQLRVSVLYANGDADTIDVTRSRRAKNNGRYYIDFSADIDQELMMIQIETDKPEGNVKARLCQKNRNI